MARIVIANNPPRMVTLAASELQAYVKKVSGATLPIIKADELKADAAFPVTLYVGLSDATEKLGLSDEGLKDGAFRVTCGQDWAAFIGHDADYHATPPYYGEGQPDKQKMIEAWTARTSSLWSSPAGALDRQYNSKLNINSLDQRGSLNAVYHFVRSLGVEWYMAGELGEEVPTHSSIPLPSQDQEVQPRVGLRVAYPISDIWFSQKPQEILWSLRLGLNAQSEHIGRWTLMSHGMKHIMTPAMYEAHPEYFALIDGERHHDLPCLSQAGLLKENVAFLRATFDLYDMPMLSVMPPDGFARVCECDRCQASDTPERGFHGLISDYVWEYVNQVAAELYQSHPDKKLSCFAYNTYLLPPTRLKKLSPNLVVGMVHGRSGNYRDSETRSQAASLRQQWLALSSEQLIIWEHYVFTNRGVIWPAFYPHAIAKGLEDSRGQTLGELVEVGWGPFEANGHALHSPGFNHLNTFITARLYWENPAEIDDLLERYYQSYYGPAAAEMKAFIAYCETNWQSMQGNAQVIEPVFVLLEKAKAKAPAGSSYAKRIGLLEDYLKPLSQLYDQLKVGREDVPFARVRSVYEAQLTIDGITDEPAWEQAPVYKLKNIVSGRSAKVATTFRMIWQGSSKSQRDSGDLYVAIHCQEPEPESIILAAREDGDPNIWNGDCIELLIETQAHSYYQIVIDPKGNVVDIDRAGKMINTRWTSNFEIKSHQTESGWNVEIRIPVAGSDQTADPLHDIIGKRPLKEFPWYFNLCRQRVREAENELTAFSPTGKPSFHDTMKFGKLYVR